MLQDRLCECLCFEIVRRPPRSTRRRSSAASDVYKRQARTVLETYDAFIDPANWPGEEKRERLAQIFRWDGDQVAGGSATQGALTLWSEKPRQGNYPAGFRIFWSTRPGSNRRPPRWQRGALPTELLVLGRGPRFKPGCGVPSRPRRVTIDAGARPIPAAPASPCDGLPRVW